MADCDNVFYGTLRARWKVLMESKARSCCSSACLTRYTYTSFFSCTESKRKTHPKKPVTCKNLESNSLYVCLYLANKPDSDSDVEHGEINEKQLKTTTGTCLLKRKELKP